ncbi:putative Zn finger protein [Kibdelosporangium banguiense]|uniref:Zn finger protein n=1 Tax=Kibdelosporangium banguiense TaxID=1365924 RepID=A0ABS4TP55_9PSEU|nr:SWIM zinc finger family protein [Kibdelosporangium banguiense]MBP2326181.1 putative Zn finger protein [Kibdelosporangium banguiense]
MIDDERARGFRAFPAGPRTPGKFAKTWWGNAWIAAMEDTALDLAQLKKGRKYAYAGNVGPITVTPGKIFATVQDGDDYSEYQTVVLLSQLTGIEWSRFLDRVAAKAGHIATLLDGEMPRDLVEAADDAGISLLPGIGDLDPECDCPGWGHPCEHAAALSYQASWLLDADPFVLLLLRGLDREQLLEGLRGTSQDTLSGDPAATAYAAPVAALPEIATPATRKPLALTPLLAPHPSDVDPAALGLLAADAASRARDLLNGAQLSSMDPWTDAVRFAAAHPDCPVDRLASASGREDLPVAVQAWEQGGEAGLSTWDEAWSPPKAVLGRARTAVAEAIVDGVLDGSEEIKYWRNRCTIADRMQIRYGTDGRWYPYVRASDNWRPQGTPHADPVSVLIDLARG